MLVMHKRYKSKSKNAVISNKVSDGSYNKINFLKFNYYPDMKVWEDALIRIFQIVFDFLCK